MKEEINRFNIGDIVVCLDVTTDFPSVDGKARWRNKLSINTTYKIEYNHTKHSMRLKENNEWWQCVEAFRLATFKEIQAYNKGIRHINDIKQLTNYYFY